VIFEEAPARALAVYAHPDDPEVSCAGTLARWAAAGCETHLVICNSGDKGSPDPSADPAEVAAVRAEEAKRAAAVMGVAGHEILGYPDGEVENNRELRERLVAHVRAVRPEVVVCPDPTAVFFGQSYVNHHDHRAVGWAALDAVAPAAASPLYFPGAGPAHRVQTMLLSGTLEPDTWVVIDDHIDAKIDALRCHRSQLEGGGDVIAEFVRSRAGDAAATAGLATAHYAEGFRRLVL
jgi:LmbE family N-acetylglucosaminyl deacetylase